MDWVDPDARYRKKMSEDTDPSPELSPAELEVGEKVKFLHGGVEFAGYVCKKNRRYAHVACDDGIEGKVPYERLIRVTGAEKKFVQSHADRMRLRFHPNDLVRFEFQARVYRGRIARLNPKRARVVCDDDGEFNVPYALLTRLVEPAEESGNLVAGDVSRGPEEIGAIAALARSLMARHLPEVWSFQFDHGVQRGGCCNYKQRTISLSHEFARRVPEAEIRDTILHEVAHAIVGCEHGHDAVWQAKAIEIGCSGERCHDEEFTPPRYIMRCVNGCWVGTARTRRRGCVCRKCGGRIAYQTFTQDRWEKETKKNPPQDSD